MGFGKDDKQERTHQTLSTERAEREGDRMKCILF
jgi:hypothetical protein